MDQKTPDPSKGGRPETPISIQEFKSLCKIQSTLSEIASYFDCDEKTIERWCEKQFNEGFVDVYKRFEGVGRVSLRRAQFRKAIEENNTVMQIWLGKQRLGQRDKTEIGGDELKPIILKYNLDDCDDDKKDE